MFQKKNKKKTWVGRVKANKTFYEDSLDVFIAWGKGNAWQTYTLRVILAFQNLWASFVYRKL